MRGKIDVDPALRWFVILAAVFAGLAALGTADLIQTRHAVPRNYPISAHLRFVLESIRPEMRQYFFEDEKDGRPFSRDERALVYQRAKMQLDKRPFGTQYDVYADGYEWLRHSVAPRPHAADQFRITIGGPDCARPYSASVFNISAMSFGALSPNAIRALNGGAKKNHFAHDTGEGGFSPYHREMGGDIIWEVGSGYFGCRNADGSFNAEKFAETAVLDQVKMVELKLSQGAKPGHGGNHCRHDRVHRERCQTTEPSLKIGRYMETTSPPMTTPRNTMMIGSSRLESAATASSTSRS